MVWQNMRNLQLLVILVLAIFAVSLIQREGSGSKINRQKNIMAPTSSIAPSPTSNSILRPTSIPDSKFFTSTPTPSSGINISNFIYPGSAILNRSRDELTLQNTDDPQVITNWYKEKIINTGMNTRSFVQTNTNGNILNKLAGAKSGFKIIVEISKKSSEEKVKISVNFD